MRVSDWSSDVGSSDLFEDFVTDADHWLPPDNIQEHPSLLVARRTSPTNVGLALLANLSAHDFGYLQGEGLVERVGRTLATLESLPRHRGHLYNWYDTDTLRPLHPLYAPTVDSGHPPGHPLTPPPACAATSHAR